MPLRDPYSLLFILFFLFINTGCKTENNRAFDDGKLQSNLSPKATRATGAFLNQYLQLKDALVTTNSAKAHEAALKMNAEMDTLRTYVQTDTQQISKTLLIQTDSIRYQLINITGNNNPNCEPQRVAFKYLSDNVLTLLKLADARQVHLYIQYSPLILNERGGYWLSTSTEIENPYFGSKMLTSGGVMDTLK